MATNPLDPKVLRAEEKKRKETTAIELAKATVALEKAADAHFKALERFKAAQLAHLYQGPAQS